MNLTLFIQRVAGICHDDQGFYHPDQPWGNHLNAQRLVASTVLRILARDQEPRNTDYLTVEVQRLARHFLPDGYNTRSAVRATLSRHDEISWQGRATFGLRKWDTALGPRNMVTRRGRTGDLIYAFLMEHGPADIETVIEHVQRTTSVQSRIVQEAINHDPARRFVRTPDGHVAANPLHQSRDAGTCALTVVPDGQRHRLGPVLQQSELLWLTRYVQALDDLAPPPPDRMALTGSRAAGFARGEPLEVTVIVDPSHRPSPIPRLAEIAVATSELVPPVRPNISILSPQQWERQQADGAPEAHHNAWLAPETAPQFKSSELHKPPVGFFQLKGGFLAGRFQGFSVAPAQDFGHSHGVCRRLNAATVRQTHDDANCGSGPIFVVRRQQMSVTPVQVLKSRQRNPFTLTQTHHATGNGTRPAHQAQGCRRRSTGGYASSHTGRGPPNTPDTPSGRNTRPETLPVELGQVLRPSRCQPSFQRYVSCSKTHREKAQ